MGDANDRTATGNGQDPFEIWMSHLNLPSVGVTMAQKVGLQMIVKFDTSGAESYEYVAQCSGRGSATRATASASRATRATTATSSPRSRPRASGPLPPRPAA